MNRLAFLAQCALLAALLSAVNAAADDNLRVPEEIEPPFYHAVTLQPGLLDDGTVWAIQDGEWAVIPFWRALEDVPDDYELMNGSDPAAPDSPLLVAGHVRIKPPNTFPSSWNLRGLGAVPIMFVSWKELEPAAADGELTFGELMSLGSVRVGTATFYLEQNIVSDNAPVSHLTLEARGTLEGGGTFDVKAIEVGLELKRVVIKLD